MSEDKFDVLITLGEDESDQVLSNRLFSRAIRPVCSPHYLRQGASFDTPESLLSATLLHDETKDAWNNWFYAAGVSTKEELPGPIFQDFNLLVTAAIAGHGVALCPVDVFREDVSKGDLLVLSDIEALEDQYYFLSTRVHRTIMVEKFSTWFLSTVASDD